MMNDNSRQQPNMLGNASLALGIASAALVFGIGFCGVVGANQGWVALAGVPILVCGFSSAFLGLLGAGLGLAGLFGSGGRNTAVAGLVLSLLGMCLFVVFLVAVRGG
ncbi:hypothetical protein [Candidatus Leptofilum sp.]|uniref:hypothetical protein n=1 Tax=Candidatus Leptofilum sp. TaxID=3241576 RepID=UPI003B598074